MHRPLSLFLVLLAIAAATLLIAGGPWQPPTTGGTDEVVEHTDGAAPGRPAAVVIREAAHQVETAEAQREGPKTGQVRVAGMDLAKRPFHLLALPVDADDDARPVTVPVDAEGRFALPQHEAGSLLLLPQFVRLETVAPEAIPRTERQVIQYPYPALLLEPGLERLELGLSLKPHLEVIPVVAETGETIVDMRLVAWMRNNAENAGYYPLSCAEDGIRRIPLERLSRAETLRWYAWSYAANPSATEQWKAVPAGELLERTEPLLLPVVHAPPLPIEFVGTDGPILHGVSVVGSSYRLDPPDEQGRWLFRRPYPQKWSVTFDAEGYLSASVSKEDLQRDSLRVEMDSETRLDLVLEDARSANGWSVTVSVDLEDVPNNRWFSRGYPTLGCPGMPDDRARADYTIDRRGRTATAIWTLDLAPLGRRSLVKLPEGGDFEIELFHFGRPISRHEVTVADREHKRVGLPANADERLLTCHVSDEDGQPVAGVTVEAGAARFGRDPYLRYRTNHDHDWLVPSATTDATGIVEIALPPEDGEVVRFLKPGYADTVVPVGVLMERNGAVRLEAGRTVVLAVLGADGEVFYGGFSNGYGAYYSTPWVHLGHGVWRPGEWRETSPDGRELKAYRDWVFPDLPAGSHAYRIESVRDFEFLHDSAVPAGEYVAPISASDIPYGK